MQTLLNTEILNMLCIIAYICAIIGMGGFSGVLLIRITEAPAIAKVLAKYLSYFSIGITTFGVILVLFLWLIV